MESVTKIYEDLFKKLQSVYQIVTPQMIIQCRDHKELHLLYVLSAAPKTVLRNCMHDISEEGLEIKGIMDNYMEGRILCTFNHRGKINIQAHLNGLNTEMEGELKKLGDS